MGGGRFLGSTLRAILIWCAGGDGEREIEVSERTGRASHQPSPRDRASLIINPSTRDTSTVLLAAIAVDTLLYRGVHGLYCRRNIINVP